MRAGLRCARGRGRAGQRRLRRAARPHRYQQPDTTRGGHGQRGRNAAGHVRGRDRADHFAGGGGQPEEDRRAVDVREEVLGHHGGHVRVRSTDGRLARERVRGTVRQGVAQRKAAAADRHGLLYRVRPVIGQRQGRVVDQLQTIAE